MDTHFYIVYSVLYRKCMQFNLLYIIIILSNRRGFFAKLIKSVWLCGYMGQGICWYLGMWVCGFVGIWACKKVGISMWVFRYVGTWARGYAGM